MPVGVPVDGPDADTEEAGVNKGPVSLPWISNQMQTILGQQKGNYQTRMNRQI